MRVLKKFFLLRALLVFFLTNECYADTEVYACQYEESGGLHWSDGAWRVTAFKNGKPFFLKVEQGSLSEESVRVAIEQKDVPAKCVVYRFEPKTQGCMNELGYSIYFDSETGRGATASLFGAKSTATSRDSVSVSTFSCQKM